MPTSSSAHDRAAEMRKEHQRDHHGRRTQEPWSTAESQECKHPHATERARNSKEDRVGQTPDLRGTLIQELLPLREGPAMFRIRRRDAAEDQRRAMNDDEHENGKNHKGNEPNRDFSVLDYVGNNED